MKIEETSSVAMMRRLRSNNQPSIASDLCGLTKNSAEVSERQSRALLQQGLCYPAIRNPHTFLFDDSTFLESVANIDL